MNRVLVTGGAGFVGHALCNKLCEHCQVTAFDNLSTGRRERLTPEVSFVNGDVRDLEALTAAMRGVDYVFHQAAFVSIRGSFELLHEELQTNALGTLHVLSAARQCGVKKLIYASSMAVYGQPAVLPADEHTPTCPVSPYGLSKLRGELYCGVFHELDTVCLRYANIYGVGQTPNPYVGVITTFIDNVKRGKPMVIFGSGAQSRDFVGLNDVVQANLLALNPAAHGMYCIGSGEERSVLELAGLIQKEIGGTIEHAAPVPGDIARIVYDIRKARAELGYSPEESLDATLPRLIEHAFHA